MQYVFGDAFVCDNAEIAKKLAFDPKVGLNCVTLDGDLYSPQGTLSGGSGSSTGQSDILKKVKDLNKLDEELRYTEHKFLEQ